MSRSLEITGRYLGERYRFDNADGSSVVIGSVLLNEASRSLAAEAGIDDTESPVGVKGECDVDELEINKTYRFFGTWSSYFNRRRQCKETQFHFRTVVAHIPHDRDGLIEYLSAAGRGKGIGPRKAAMLVEWFGIDDVLHACRGDSSMIAEIANIRQDQAHAFAEQLRSQAATENATLEVDKLLHGRGFPRALVRRVIKAWGNKAAEQITTDPYSLMQFRGVGFGLTDKLFIGLGKNPAAIERQALCLWHSMHSDNDGHTWFEAMGRVKLLQRAIGGGDLDPRAAIIQGKEYAERSDGHYGAIATARSHGKDGPLSEIGETLWLAEGINAAAEEYVAKAIAEAQNETFAQEVTRYDDFEVIKETVLKFGRCQRCSRQLTAATVHVLDGVPYGPTCIGYVDLDNRAEVYSLPLWLEQNPVVERWIDRHPGGVITLPEVSLWPEVDRIEGITDHQRAGVERALGGRIAILGGSPGTGKTHTLAAIIKALWKSGRVGLHEIGIFAPTGKAAVRLTEALAKHGLSVRARTAHSLLGIGSIDDTTDSPEWSFAHNERNPWPFKVVVGDEQSMPPINMMSAILKARPKGCHVLLVGDVNQLPPVGNGAPFRDMINAGMPYGELRKIERNDGGIVQACADIRDEKPWVDDYLDGSKNLLITGESKPEAQIARALRIIQEAAEAGHDPVWDVQVLTAVNQRSELSRTALNKRLQDVLNPNPVVDGTPFRVGDKVVCLKNGFYETTFAIDPFGDDHQTNDRGEVYVANGELGAVEQIEEKSLTIRLESPERLIRVPRGKASRGKGSDDGDDKEDAGGTGCNWDLGYALSVHKFQGSEQKIVVVMLDSYFGAKQICDRAWIYTAISRAQEKCYLVGSPATAKQCCRVQKMSLRKTFLANRIRLAVFQMEAVGL